LDKYVVSDTIIMPQPHDKQDIELPNTVDPAFDKFRPNAESRAEEERLRNQLELLKNLSDKEESNRRTTINQISQLDQVPEIIDSKLIKIAHLIERNCRDAAEFLGRYNGFTSRTVLYRGLGKDIKDEFLQGESHTHRSPTNVKPEVQEFFDKILEIGGFTALRRNSISCVNNSSTARSHGNAYLIFPFDNCTYTFSERYSRLSERLASVDTPFDLLTDLLDFGTEQRDAAYELQYLIADLKNKDSQIHQSKRGVTPYPKATQELILILTRAVDLLKKNKTIPPKMASFIKKRISKLISSERRYKLLVYALDAPAIMDTAFTPDGAEAIIKKFELKNEKSHSYAEMLSDVAGEVMICGKYYAVSIIHLPALRKIFKNVVTQPNA
jgi:hypothetical protein